MAYIDKAVMIRFFAESELIQLTDRAGAGTIDDAVLNQAMTTAESEVDSYVGAGYILPLSTVPDVLKAMTGDIARYRLYDNRATEEVQKRYDRAISWLRDISKGVVSLGIKTTDPEPESTVAAVSARPQVFTNDLFDRMAPRWPTQ